jgi:hypothetical protein
MHQSEDVIGTAPYGHEALRLLEHAPKLFRFRDQTPVGVPDNPSRSRGSRVQNRTLGNRKTNLFEPLPVTANRHRKTFEEK